jgi:hypothetical protein
MITAGIRARSLPRPNTLHLSGLTWIRPNHRLRAIDGYRPTPRTCRWERRRREAPTAALGDAALEVDGTWTFVRLRDAQGAGGCEVAVSGVGGAALGLRAAFDVHWRAGAGVGDIPTCIIRLKRALLR